MRKQRTFIALASMLVGIILALAWGLSRANEPVYQRKTLAFWLRQKQWSYIHELYPGREGEEASKAIQAIGTNGLPLLVKLVSRTEVPARLKVFWFLSRHQSWFPSGIYRWYSERVSCSTENELGTAGFEVLRDKAKSATPELIGLLTSRVKAVRVSAEIALTFANSLYPGEYQYKDEDGNLLSYNDVLLAIGADVADPKAAIPFIIPCLTNGNVVVRTCATNALRRIKAAAISK